MTIYCIGLNHETAPVEVREQFAVAAPRQGTVSKEISNLEGVEEAVLLSTCNRMEVYLAVQQTEQVDDFVKHHLAGTKVDSSLDKHFYTKNEDEVVKHLCNVVSGINSMVLGETEIFGQVKEAYRQALKQQATGKILNKLFQKSFTVGKKVRNQTKIQIGQTSVGSVAVDLAEKIFGHLAKSKVMIIGAGEMSRITAQSLQSRGAQSIFVANRSYDRAKNLAQELKGEAVRFDHWAEVMAEVDVVISSTGATHHVVHLEDFEGIRKKRKYRPIFLIDIAVPRDIDPAIGDIEEVYLYDMDTLQQLANEGKVKRQQQMQLCQEIIAQEVQKITKHQAYGKISNRHAR